MKRRLAMVLVVLIFIFFAWLESSWGQDFTPGIILVKFHHGVTEEQINEMNQRLGTRVLEKYDFGGRPFFYVIGVPEGQEDQMVREYLKASEIVSSVGKEFTRR